jgi:hypothetical protein
VYEMRGMGSPLLGVLCCGDTGAHRETSTERCEGTCFLRVSVYRDCD